MTETATLENDVDGIIVVDKGNTKRLVDYLLDRHQVVPLDYREAELEREGGLLVRQSSGRIDLVTPMGDLPRLRIYVLDKGLCRCYAQVGEVGNPSKQFSVDIPFNADGMIDLDAVEPLLRQAMGFVGQELGVDYGARKPLVDILSDIHDRRSSLSWQQCSQEKTNARPAYHAVLKEREQRFFNTIAETVLAITPDAVEILLHGSRATNDHKRTSDWDFLIVLPQIDPDRRILLNSRGGLLDIERIAGRKTDLQVASLADTTDPTFSFAREEGFAIWKKEDPAPVVADAEQVHTAARRRRPR